MKKKAAVVYVRQTMLAVMVTGVLLAVVGSVAFAAPAQSTKSSATYYVDPYTFAVVAMEADEIVLAPRLSIRLPERPPLRSAFRPVY
jgi:hypothetical protein